MFVHTSRTHPSDYPDRQCILLARGGEGGMQNAKTRRQDGSWKLMQELQDTPKVKFQNAR